MINQKTLLRAAVMTIALGIIIEIAQFILIMILNKDSQLKIFLADFVNKFSWTYIVCTSIAITAALTKNEMKTGLAALVSVPVGLYLATVLHKAVLKGMGLDTAAAGNLFFLPVLIKTIEYGTLGIMFPYLIKKNKNFSHFILTGLSAGILFGFCQVIYKVTTAPAAISFIKLLPLIVNEIIIPVGCSVIIYSSNFLADRVKASAQNKNG